MREIKFRGKHLMLKNLNGAWVYGSLYSDGADDREPMIIEREGAGRYYPVDPATVGQFTGLLDVDGREIYEGDVVRTDDWSSPSYIRWDVVTASFVVDRWSINLAHVGAIKIIGNLHNDPELLEDKKDA